MRLTVLPLAFVGLIGIGALPQTSRPADACVLPGEQPESLNVTSALDRAAEARAIESTGGRAARFGDTLRLRLRSEATNAFSDFIDCTRSWERYVRYVLRGSGPRQQGFVVFLSQGESTNFFWLDDARDTVYILRGAPKYSPDSSFFVAANSDLDAGYSPNALEVYRIEGSALARSFEIIGGHVGFSVDSVVNDSVVHVHMLRMRPDFSTDSLPAYLARRTAGWSLHLGRP